MAATSVSISVFGPTRVSVGGQDVALTPADARVLTALVHLVEAPPAVLDEFAWPRGSSLRALNSSVYRIRQLLGHGALTRSRTLVGINAEVVDVDAWQFMRIASESQQLPAERAQAALDLVRGQPFLSMSRLPLWGDIIFRWHERIEDQRDVLLDEALTAGDFQRVITDTREQLGRNPTASRRTSRFATALASVGRPVEALRAIEQCRRAVAELGAALDASLLTLERRLLTDPESFLDQRINDRSPVRSRAPRASIGDQVFVGREVELRSVTDAMDSGTRVALVTGLPGMGLSEFGRRVSQEVHDRLTVWVRGVRGVPLGSGVLVEIAAQVGVDVGDRDPIRLLREMSNAARSMQLVVIIDDAQWIDDQAIALLEALHDRVGSAMSLLVLWHVAPGQSEVELSSRWRRSFRVHLDELSPQDVNAWVRQVPDASLTAAALIESCGGVPALLAAAFAGGPFDLDVALIERMRLLSPRARDALYAVSLIGHGVAVSDLGRAGLVRGEADVAVRELTRSGWAELQDGHLTPPNDRVMLSVRNGLAYSDRIRILGPLLEALESPQTTAEFLQRARLVATVRPDAVDEIGRHLLAAMRLVDESEGDRMVQTASDGLALLSGLGVNARDLEVELVTARGVGLRTDGYVMEGTIELEAAFRAASQSGSSDLAATAAVAMSNPAMLMATNAGVDAEALLHRWIGLDELSPIVATKVMGARAFHELCRRDANRGEQLARQAVAAAREVGDDDTVNWVLQAVTPEVSCVRTLVDLAAEMGERAIGRGWLTRLTRSQVYMLCASLRAQTAGFDEVIAIELLALSGPSAPPTVQLRGAGLRAAKALLRHDDAAIADAVKPILASGAGRAESPPMAIWAFERLINLAVHDNWLSIPATTLLGAPVHPELVGTNDRLLISLAEAAAAGSSRQELNQFQSALTAQPPVDRWASSTLWPARLPALTRLAVDIGDRDFAWHVVDQHLHLARTDLSMLPFVHFGPASAWLVGVAELAGHQAVEELAAATQQRCAELGATVLGCG